MNANIGTENYTFNELSPVAKERAIKDYINMAHTKNVEIDFYFAQSALIDADFLRFDIDGKITREIMF